MKLSSKAQTLEELKPIVNYSKVLPVYRFYANEYLERKTQILNQIRVVFDVNIIVRSSSSSEDNFEASNAGGFDSVLDVDIRSEQEIHTSIESVILSYGDKLNDSDEVFVQPMLSNVTMSGVVFTADIDTLSSYYVINFDESGSTNSVTGGCSNDLKAFISIKNSLTVGDKKIERIYDD